jgi:polar amino acid transport system permease protein
MTWSWSFAWHILPALLQGLWWTVKASLLASAVALVLGLLVAIVRYHRPRILRHVLTLLIDFVRGTPLLVQLYFVFYALPGYGVTLSPFVAGFLTLGVSYTAYTAEVYRAGIENVPRGQWDAVTALDLPRLTVWWRVILPQAFRPIGPALGNYVIAMFKESVLLSAITVPELLEHALNIANLTYRYVEPITLVGLLFWVISYPCARGVRYWESRVRAKYE